MTRWWLPRPPSGLHHHQRVLATRWTVPPASIWRPPLPDRSQRRGKRAQMMHLCVIWALGVSFFLKKNLCFNDNNGPKRCQTRRLGHFVGLSPRQPAAPHLPHPSLAWTRPTKAHAGRQEPTKKKKGLNDARRVVWAISSFFSCNFLFYWYYYKTQHPPTRGGFT